jgi:hypothetical protein
VSGPNSLPSRARSVVARVLELPAHWCLRDLAQVKAAKARLARASVVPRVPYMMASRLESSSTTERLIVVLGFVVFIMAEAGSICENTITERCRVLANGREDLRMIDWISKSIAIQILSPSATLTGFIARRSRCLDRYFGKHQLAKPE